jgi:enoyl-CoA hydratase/carnithine racemase
VSTIRVEVAADGRIARLTLDRPDRLNALSRELLRELVVRCAELDRLEPAVVIVAGSGRAFSAGFDLGDFAAPEPGLSAEAAADLGRAATDALEQVRAVTIAAIHGHCIGGGVVLASACDLRVAAADARFAIPEIDLGIPLAWGGIPRLVRELGPARTRELVMTGSAFGAADAEAYGFVNRVVPADELAAAVDALAATVAAKPRAALRATKQQVRIAAEALVPTHHTDADAVLLAAAPHDPESQAAARVYLSGRSGGGAVS